MQRELSRLTQQVSGNSGEKSQDLGNSGEKSQDILKCNDFSNYRTLFQSF